MGGFFCAKDMLFFMATMAFACNNQLELAMVIKSWRKIADFS